MYLKGNNSALLDSVSDFVVSVNNLTLNLIMHIFILFLYKIWTDGSTPYWTVLISLLSMHTPEWVNMRTFRQYFEAPGWCSDLEEIFCSFWGLGGHIIMWYWVTYSHSTSGYGHWTFYRIYPQIEILNVKWYSKSEYSCLLVGYRNRSNFQELHLYTSINMDHILVKVKI